MVIFTLTELHQAVQHITTLFGVDFGTIFGTI